MSNCYYAMHVLNEKAKNRYSRWKKCSGLLLPLPIGASVDLGEKYCFEIKEIYHFLEDSSWMKASAGDIISIIGDRHSEDIGFQGVTTTDYANFSKQLRAMGWKRIM